MNSIPYIRTITLAAGGISDVIDGVFNSIYLKSTTTGTGLSVKFDNNDFTEFPANFGMSFIDENGNMDIFKSVRIKNTSAGSITFTLTLFLGSGMDNNNVVVDSGSITVGAVTVSDITGQTQRLKVDIEEQSDASDLNVNDDALQTLVSTLDAVVDSILTAVNSIDTKLTTIDSVLDDIKTSNDTIATNTAP